MNTYILHQDINHKNWLMDTNTIILMRREKITGCYLNNITDDKSQNLKCKKVTKIAEETISIKNV